MRKLFRKVPLREAVLICVLTGLCGILLLLPGSPQLADTSGKHLVAEVVAVDNSGLSKHGLLQYGSQHLTVKVSGKLYPANNELRAQMELDKLFAPGDRVTVMFPESDANGQPVLTAVDHWRNGWSFALFGMFCILLVIFGAWTGVKALFSFVFSCVVIWKLIVPLVLRGYPASWLIFAAVVLLTAVITFLVAGFTRKGVAAFAGAIAGVFSGLAMAHLFGMAMHINGAVMPFSQALVYSGFADLDLMDIFVGAVMLASCGAVMDLAMDIAAGVEEVARHNPELPAKELIRSGFRIGRSVVGTMTTTLLLAYSGGYLTLLMMFSAQGTPPAVFLNNPLVVSEVVKTLIGSFSLVLVAPLTAVASGVLFQKRT